MQDGPNATPTPPLPAAPAASERAYLGLLAVLALLVGLLYGSPDRARAWGWDESMHAGLPAERIALGLEGGDLGAVADVVHGSMQYPFVWPLVVGVSHAALHDATAGSPDAPGQLEALGRSLGRWSMALLALGLGLLARECWRGTRSPWGLVLAPLLVLASPLVIDYAGTWFLEVPFAAVATWALVLWLVRARLLTGASTGGGGHTGPRAWLLDLATGALVMAAFFTKFNYGLLLGLGLGLDLLLDLVLVLRGPGLAPFLRSTGRLALVPALAFAWWFLLPLPFGADIAAAHREAFAAFLAGNQELVRTAGSMRALHWLTSFVATPRLLLLVLVGLGMSLVFVVRQLPGGCASARSQLRLWLVLLAMALPIATHNFHLDRFLVVLVPASFALAAAGWSALLAALLGRRFGFEARPTVLLPLALAPLLVLAGLVGRGLDGTWAFGATVGFAEPPAVLAYQQRVLVERQATGPGRPLSTAGLARAAHDGLLDLVAAELEARSRELGRPATLGWLGISSELSPGALHIGVHERQGSQGSADRLVRDAATVRGDGNPAMVMTFQGLDPGWNDEQLFAWAAGFDVVFTTTPPQLKPRGDRAFLASYQERLLISGRFEPVELGEVAIPQTFGDDQVVRLYAVRPR